MFLPTRRCAPGGAGPTRRTTRPGALRRVTCHTDPPPESDDLGAGEPGGRAPNAKPLNHATARPADARPRFLAHPSDAYGSRCAPTCAGTHRATACRVAGHALFR